ncbi:MAG: amidohydrolase [Cyclobacteriaceae bacterium]|nr:amidohydrolase [Cyclobacteriaceae bacterium]
MNDLRITLIQTPLHWEDPVANRAMLEEKIWTIKQQTDVILLPEMFTTGFTMNASPVAEAMNLQTTRWMRQMADQTGALILGSIIVQESSRYFNRLIWMEPGGRMFHYDKRHLFRMAEEHLVFSGGATRLVESWKGWRICPLVCYDLRFPVWSRNHYIADEKRMAYDLLVYVANWPQPRVFAWDTLLKARAIENLAYVAGVNRVGPDPKGTIYNGHSAVIEPRGQVIWSGDEEETLQTVVLDAAKLREHRDRFPAYLDADNFRLD